jgi:predicted glycosyltransferase
LAKSIWIDLDNAPHVPLFAPIIRHYRDSGTNVVITARDHAQTVELLRLKGFDETFQVIGKHYGKGKLSKVRGLVVRALQLRSHINKLRSDGVDIGVAVSHGSRSMVLAARSLGIPILTMYDYEYTETRIFNRFSTKVLLPEGIPDDVLDDIGLVESKRAKYPGLKEELYISDFRPDENFRREFLQNFGVEDTSDLVVAVVRPPATTANYHAGASELLVSDVLEHLLSADNTFTAIVPRSSAQAKEIKDELETADFPDHRYAILDTVVDGRDLAYAADLLISGGGTMNREAALLGTPVYSIFSGRQGSLDAEMERQGVIRFIRNGTDVGQIELKPRYRDGGVNLPTDRVEKAVIAQINSFLQSI